MSLNSPHFNVSKFQFYPVGGGTGIGQKEYLTLMSKVENAYSKEIKGRGGELKVLTEYWKNDAVNGGANQDGAWNIKIYGGYARHPLASSDAVLFLACHEIGHHLGGTLFYPPPQDWGAAEGQADYFASLKCMRRLLQGEDNEKFLEKLKIPQVVTDECRASFVKLEDRQICQRVAMAGYQMNKIWVGGPGKFRFDTPSSKNVAKSYVRHPSYQCRLDTYFQGSLCPVPESVKLEFDDFQVGSCTIASKHKVGRRPACWFNESDF